MALHQGYFHGTSKSLSSKAKGHFAAVAEINNSHPVFHISEAITRQVYNNYNIEEIIP